MSFTYDITLADSISQIRNIIQDTVEVVADFQDEELQFYLDVNSNNVYKAAAEAAMRLYIKYSKAADIEEVGKVRIEYVNRAQAMKDLYDQIIAETVKRSGKGMIFFGGINRDEFNNNLSDFSNMKPAFTKEGIFHDPCDPAVDDPCTDNPFSTLRK